MLPGKCKGAIKRGNFHLMPGEQGRCEGKGLNFLITQKSGKEKVLSGRSDPQKRELEKIIFKDY